LLPTKWLGESRKDIQRRALTTNVKKKVGVGHLSHYSKERLRGKARRERGKSRTSVIIPYEKGLSEVDG